MEPTTVIAKPMRVSPFGVSPRRPMPRAIGSKIALMRERDSFEMDIGLAYEPEGGALTGGELLERLLAQPADRLASLAAGLHDAGRPEAGEVPRDERLGQ